MERTRIDFATLLGIFAGFGLIGYTIYISGHLTNYVNAPSLMIVLGGTLAATMINYPFHVVLPVIIVASRTLFQTDFNYMKILHEFEELAQVIRVKGPVEIDKIAGSYGDKFMARALKLVADDIKEDALKEILARNILALQERHHVGQEVMKTMGKWAPAFGMLGTVVGLIGLMSRMSDPATIGPQMAIALVTTFYGLLLSNLIFLPLSGKLKHLTEMEVLKNQMIMEGAIALKYRISPSDMVERMKAYIPSDSQLKNMRTGRTVAADDHYEAEEEYQPSNTSPWKTR